MVSGEFSKLTWLKKLHGVDVTPAEFRVLVTIFNYSDKRGNNAAPGRSALIADTGLTEKHIRTCVRALEARGLLLVTEEGGRRNGRPLARGWSLCRDPQSVLSTETDTSEPVLSTAQSVLSTAESVLSTGESVLSTAQSVLSTPPSERQIKIRLLSDQSEAPAASDDVIDAEVVPDPAADSKAAIDTASGLARQLAERITANGAPVTPTRAWTAAMSSLIHRNISPSQIAYVIDFATADQFWSGVISDAAKFAEKYDQLAVKATAEYRRQNSTRSGPAWKRDRDDQWARWQERYGNTTQDQKAISN